MCEIIRTFLALKMTSTKQSDQSDHALNHPIREHSYSLPADQSRKDVPSSELTPEERKIHKKIIQQQLEGNKENIYQSIDLYTAYHLLKRNDPETTFSPTS